MLARWHVGVDARRPPACRQRRVSILLESTLMVLVDFDQVVVTLHGLYRVAFLRSATPEAFLELWSKPRGCGVRLRRGGVMAALMIDSSIFWPLALTRTQLAGATMRTAAVARVVFALVVGLGACGGNGRSSPDSTPVGDHGAELDAPAGDEDCPVVGYAACGGDLLGTWLFRSLCPDDPVAAAALCEHPYDDRPECIGTGNEAICDGTHSGSLVFLADGSVEIDTQVRLAATWSFTDKCLAAVVATGSTAEERCGEMASARLSCVYEGRCTCVGDPIVESDTNSAPYAISGDELTIGEDPPATYCVDGDRLTMDYYAFHPVSWRYWVLVRE